VARLARTHLAVARVLDVLPATGVSHRGFEDALVLRRRVVLEEDMLRAPEAPVGEGGDFGCRGHVQETGVVEGRVRSREREEAGGEVAEAREHRLIYKSR
jgi:hypothetical protein